MEERESAGSGQRGRTEIRILVAAVVAILLVGSAYTLFFGSADKSRAGVDSPNAHIPMIGSSRTVSPPKP
jgi:flagellar basal body-associated protein FliL